MNKLFIYFSKRNLKSRLFSYITKFFVICEQDIKSVTKKKLIRVKKYAFLGYSTHTECDTRPGLVSSDRVRKGHRENITNSISYFIKINIAYFLHDLWGGGVFPTKKSKLGLLPYRSIVVHKVKHTFFFFL